MKKEKLMAVNLLPDEPKAEEANEPKKRARTQTAGSPQKRTRRNFAVELAAVEGRVQTTLNLIERAKAMKTPEAKEELLAMAEETLRG